MIKLEKRLMQWCEDCEMFAPCCFKLREKTEDKKSFDINTVIVCQHADICSHAVHQYQKSCENTPIIKENETVVDQNKTLDEQGLPSCWTCEFYNVDFGVCDLLMRSNIDVAEYTCCTEYKRKEKEK